MTAQPLHHGQPGQWEGGAFAAGFGVNSHLTANRLEGAGRPGSRSGSSRRGRGRREPVENDQYMAFCVRILRAAGRRIAEGDVEALPELAALQQELDKALATAVTGLRDFGYSWGQIASRLGVTRQAAQQRWSTGHGDQGASGGSSGGDS